MKYDTAVIHGIAGKDPEGAVVPPVYLSTTFAQNGVGDYRRFMYTRGGNPSRAALEELAAVLEGAAHGFAFSSGMAATATALSLFEGGGTILFTNNVYGGTFRYASNLLKNSGLSYYLVDDFNSIDFNSPEFAKLPDIKAIFIETPSNPLLQVTDIKKLAGKARGRGIKLIVDNTFMTSYFQKPLDLGADFTVYSATKYYSGHSDVLAGLLLVNDEALAERIKFLQNTLGNGLAAHDSYMLMRSIRTLAVRMEKHEKNAATVTAFLSSHPKVKRMYYPGLNSEEELRIQNSQSTGRGAVLSLLLAEDLDLAKFVSSLELFQLAVSLGSVESLVCHPYSMTHEAYPEELRRKVGIAENLIRLSVGIENSEDLVADLEQGFRKAIG